MVACTDLRTKRISEKEISDVTGGSFEFFEVNDTYPEIDSLVAMGIDKKGSLAEKEDSSIRKFLKDYGII